MGSGAASGPAALSHCEHKHLKATTPHRVSDDRKQIGLREPPATVAARQPGPPHRPGWGVRANFVGCQDHLRVRAVQAAPVWLCGVSQMVSHWLLAPGNLAVAMSQIQAAPSPRIVSCRTPPPRTRRGAHFFALRQRGRIRHGGLASQIFSFASKICSLSNANSAYCSSSRRTLATSPTASCRPFVFRRGARGMWPRGRWPPADRG